MTVPDLEPAARRLAALLPGVPDSALGAPTPCADTTVAGLLDHIMGLAEGLRASAREGARPGAPVASAAHLDPSGAPPASAAGRPGRGLARTGARGRGSTSAGGVEMPAAEIAAVTLDELVIHGWDLARATGQPYEPDPGGRRGDPAVPRGVRLRAEGTPGLFGPAFPVPDDASPFDRARPDSDRARSGGSSTRRRGAFPESGAELLR